MGLTRYLTILQFNRSTPEADKLLKKQGCCARFIDSKIFMPNFNPFSRSFVISPTTFNIPHETVTIETADGLRLFGYLLLQLDSVYSSLPTILFFHGNGGNIGDCLQLLHNLYQKINCNILAIDYRGFGLSEGLASENGVYLDAQSTFEYAVNRSDLDSSKLILYGISLGGAVVIDLATHPKYKNQIAAIILENTFANLHQLVVSKLPKCCKGPIELLPLSSKFCNDEKIGQVMCPTLLVSGLKDKIIPPIHMNQLYVGSRAVQKKILRFPQGEHLNTWSLPGYSKQVAEFVEDAIKNYPVIANSINNNHFN